METVLTLFGILTAVLSLVAFDLASFRFGVDSREQGDWHPVDGDRRSL